MTVLRAEQFFQLTSCLLLIWHKGNFKYQIFIVFFLQFIDILTMQLSHNNVVCFLLILLKLSLWVNYIFYFYVL